jgi:hypothetical protein
MERLAPYENNSNTDLSRLISLSILDRNGTEIPIQTTKDDPIKIIIPLDPTLMIPSMIVQNVASMNSTPHNQLFHYHYINITTILPISIHIEIHPFDTNLSYLLIYKFDQLPQLNSSLNQTDGWKLFCPWSK